MEHVVHSEDCDPRGAVASVGTLGDGHGARRAQIIDKQHLTRQYGAWCGEVDPRSAAMFAVV